MMHHPEVKAQPPEAQSHDQPVPVRRSISAWLSPGIPRGVSPDRLLAFLAAFLLTGGIDAAPPPVLFEETSLIIDAKSGRFEFQVELAASPEQRGRGLMFREDLAEDRGMLFDFGKPQRASMWMRNTYVPLDMLFIDGKGRITQIATDTQPLSDAVIASREPVRAVLELRAGVTAKLGIEPGDRVVHPLFAQPESNSP